MSRISLTKKTDTAGQIRYIKKYNKGFFGDRFFIHKIIQEIQNELISIQRRAKDNDDFDKIEALRQDINYYFSCGNIINDNMYDLILTINSIGIFLNTEKIFFTRRTRLLRLLNKLIELNSQGKKTMYMTRFFHLYEVS